MNDRPISGFYLLNINNFAIIRERFLAVRFPKHYPLYRRGIPIWRSRLLKEGYVFYRVPGALGVHAPPASLLDWVLRMLVFGRDFVAKEDFSFDHRGETKERRNLTGRFVSLIKWPLLRFMRFLGAIRILVKEDLRNVLSIVLSLPICLASVVLSTLGALITCFNRDLVYNAINAREADS